MLFDIICGIAFMYYTDTNTATDFSRPCYFFVMYIFYPVHSMLKNAMVHQHDLSSTKCFYNIVIRKNK